MYIKKNIMRIQNTYLLLLLSILLTVSCSNDDDAGTVENLKNVTDCSLSYSANPNEYLVGICLNGTNSAKPNETITFASKATANFSEIIWTIESGSMEIINVANSTENIVEVGRIKTIATIKFNSDFSGGIITAEAVNDNGERAAMNHIIEVENDL